MKVLTVGHKYELANLDKLQETGQTIQFIEKAKDKDGLFVTVNDGTTNEEVLNVLIDRINTMNAAFPCVENTHCIEHLEGALHWLNKRTADRLKRNVEGKPIL